MNNNLPFPISGIPIVNGKHDWQNWLVTVNELTKSRDQATKTGTSRISKIKNKMLLQIPDYRIKSVSHMQKSIVNMGKLSCFIIRLRQRVKISANK